MKFSGSGMVGFSAVCGLVLGRAVGVKIWARQAKQFARPSRTALNARSTPGSSHETHGKSNACAMRRDAPRRSRLPVREARCALPVSPLRAWLGAVRVMSFAALCPSRTGPAYRPYRQAFLRCRFWAGREGEWVRLGKRTVEHEARHVKHRNLEAGLHRR